MIAEPTTAAGRAVDTQAGVTSQLVGTMGLLVLASGTTLGFGRVFAGWGFLSTLVPLAVAAWLVAAILRRFHVPLLASIAIHSAAGVVAMTLAFAAQTSFFGLPTAETLRTLSADVSRSFGDIPDLVAPVAASTGFLVVIAAGLWVLAQFGDVAALRFRGPVQAAVPYVAVFLTTGLLAREERRTFATGCFIAGVALYAATEVFSLTSSGRWVGNGRRGSRSAATAAAVIAVFASLGAMSLGPILPGGPDAVVNLRNVGKGPGARSVVSPFVGIRSLLGPRSNRQMFTVHADRASYWRLTALERYDANRDIWVSSGNYSTANGALRSNTADDVPVSRLRQDVALSGLQGPWLPAAYEPTSVSAGAKVSFDAESSSLILADDGPEDFQYGVVSRIPDFWAALQGESPAGASVGPKYLEVPPLSPLVTSKYEDIVRGLTDPASRMRALQDWFRSEFTYDESVDYSKSDDPLARFLQDRHGFCQQFSSAFALLARYDGVPSRVAVGFTTGDPTPADADEPGREGFDFVVSGRHAHAWPEVYLDGIGWVSFEPTPGRGNPATAAYTGAASAQAEPPETVTSTTVGSATPTSAEVPATSPPTTSSVDSPRAEPESGKLDSASRVSSVALVVAVLALLGVALLGVIVWRSRPPSRVELRSGSASGPAGRMGNVWVRMLDALSDLGIEASAMETPLEFSRRAGAELMARDSLRIDDAIDENLISGVADGLGVIAAGESLRRYSLGGVSVTICDEAVEALRGLEELETLSSRRRGGNALSLAGRRR